ncbi:SRPBCC family protein [Isoptericola sp. NPDC056618]|uniref:SRPBCC family protein n=1 Tax=Isoptericola sp. NPDC056618 TaxID=3345878 RepID=UPI00367B604A
MSESAKSPTSDGLGGLKESIGGLARAFGDRAVSTVSDKVGSVTDKLTDYAQNPGGSAVAEGAKTLAEGGSPLKAGAKSAVAAVKDKVSGIFGGGGDDGGSGGGHRFINIVEAIDVGAPIDVVYNAWTEYDTWPDFMKKVEKAQLDEDEGTVSFEGKVFWSNRRWEATIVDQIATRRVVWDSTGDKGTLSGAVTFHPLADDLTRIVVVVEYRPRGFMEKVANVWRPVGRRLRLELKFFVHHVMTDVVLHPDDLEGYRAEIQDEEIVRSHEDVVAEEQQDQGDEEGAEEDEEGAEEGEEGAEGGEEGAEEPEESDEEPEEEPEEESEEEPKPRRRRSR